jgi:uncharacterized cupredoxin-like copper-binding protein
VSLGGSSYAAVKLAKNSVGTREIKTNGVGASEIKAKAVRSSEVRDDSLTGDDINESTLGQVPSAATATSAQSAQTAQSLAGSTITKINYQAQTNTGATQIFSGGGMTLSASCTAAGDITLTAGSTVNNAIVHAANANITISSDQDDSDANRDRSILYAEDDDFDNGQTLDVMPDPVGVSGAGSDSNQSTLTFVNPNGSVVTIQFLTEEVTNGLGTANDCFVIGNASQS